MSYLYPFSYKLVHSNLHPWSNSRMWRKYIYFKYIIKQCSTGMQESYGGSIILLHHHHPTTPLWHDAAAYWLQWFKPLSLFPVYRDRAVYEHQIFLARTHSRQPADWVEISTENQIRIKGCTFTSNRSVVCWRRKKIRCCTEIITSTLVLCVQNRKASNCAPQFAH